MQIAAHEPHRSQSRIEWEDLRVRIVEGSLESARSEYDASGADRNSSTEKQSFGQFNDLRAFRAVRIEIVLSGG